MKMHSCRQTVMMAVVAVGMAGSLAGGAAAQTKQPVTHEALWLMPRVGAPSLSPDGKSVVVSVTEPSYDEKEQQSDLWIVPTDRSSAPRRLTSTKATESHVANTLENWSALQRMRVPSRLLVWPNATHWITGGEDSRHFYEEVHAWLRRWLAPVVSQTTQQ
jgi:dipeptidyl aminopeptidase/acylaminoacyl peptidase